MEENILVKLLIVIGVISLIVSTVAGTFLGGKLFGFLGNTVPFLYCAKDSDGQYTLAKPVTSSRTATLCRHADDMLKLSEAPQLCDIYEGEKKDACLGLLTLASDKAFECLQIFTGDVQNTIDPNEVKKYCEILKA